MTEFLKYPHLERLISPAVEGILDGVCYIFYKIDGTNGSVWWNPKHGVSAGSRNRDLTEGNDNAGFREHVYNNLDIISFYQDESMRRFRLYGEWLVPHSLKTYRNSAWNKFYIFDVFDNETNQFVHYDDYKVWLNDFNLGYIPPLAIIKNPSEEDLYKLLKKTGQFLVEDGKGDGEGLVIKNYGWKNKFDQVTWAKMVTNEFKEVHHREMGAPEINSSLTYEEMAVRDFLTSAFIQKERAKIIVAKNEDGGDVWLNNWIPELLGRVWHEFVSEEIMNILKKYKNPKINFKFLQQLVVQAVKKEIGI